MGHHVGHPRYRVRRIMTFTYVTSLSTCVRAANRRSRPNAQLNVENRAMWKGQDHRHNHSGNQLSPPGSQTRTQAHLCPQLKPRQQQILQMASGPPSIVMHVQGAPEYTRGASNLRRTSTGRERGYRTAPMQV